MYATGWYLRFLLRGPQFKLSCGIAKHVQQKICKFFAEQKNIQHSFTEHHGGHKIGTQDDPENVTNEVY